VAQSRAGGCIIHEMRVLIADRNAWLLGSISRTFAHSFSIQTATTHEQCNDLLLRGQFDLAVISEKLADGPGLQLLGQIARNSPDTLRVFAARRSRLQLLKGKLGPFGLFRTLAYPINPQELLSALTLARAGLEIDVPEASAPAPAPVRPVAERISITSADVMLAVNVPKAIASMRKVRPAPVARPASDASFATESVHARVPASGLPQLIQAQHPAPQPTPSRAAVAGSAAPSRLPSQSEPFQQALVSRKAHMHRAPMRTKVALGATIAAVFLVTTLTLNLVDSSVHVTHASDSRQGIAQADISPPPRSSTPVGLMPVFRPVPSGGQRIERKPDATRSDVEPTDPQIAASTTPMADPSTFGSEAYEPIYSN
jgi:ActR/RegA family two-component response regulator